MNSKSKKSKIQTFIDNMRKKYTAKNVMTILLISIIAYIYCIIFAPYIEKYKNNSVSKFIDKIHKTCFFNCKSKQCKQYMEKCRGENYFIATPVYEQLSIKGCILTFWGATHFLFYFILTFLFPNFYIEFFIMGIGFEVYEYYKFNCHDYNDIFLNTFGIILGNVLSPYK